MQPHTVSEAAPVLRKPDLATDRPQPVTPIWHQFPAELQARPQWVVWRYEWRVNPKQTNGKWTKVPYNARTAKPASTTARHTWSSFADAKAAFLARADYFDGIGYVFSKDDPFCGADFDHCLENDTPNEWATAHIAALRASGAYIEVSVSGSGIHAITRATLPGKGIKRPLGEVYDRGRFFTISGRVFDPTPIGDGQAAIDALHAALAGASHSSKPKALRDGTAGTGDRAAALAEHPEVEWEAARELLRTKGDLLIKRSLAATKTEGTQGFFATRLLWAEIHQRWPHIGLYRADGSLDDSQTRAVMARALYGRGFTFPEYVVIMAHHFAAYCLAKWGTKEAWREELAALWANARDNTPYAPKVPTNTPKSDVAISAKPRGRASNHAQQVERVYTLLQEARAGAQALVNTKDLAAAANMHRVTLAGILAELRSAGRIETRRNGRYGGLIVAFPDVAIVCKQVAESGAVMLEMTNEDAAPIEETSTNSKSCVSSESRDGGYNLPAYNPPLQLADAVCLAFDAVHVDRETGEKQRITRKRLLLALAELGEWREADIDAAIATERQRRHIAAIVAGIRSMKPPTLRAQLRLMEKLSDKSRLEETNLYKFTDWAARQLRAALANQPQTGQKPRPICEALPDLRAAGAVHRAQIEQQELAELWFVADRELAQRTPTTPRHRVQPMPEPQPVVHSGIIARLHALKAQREAQQVTRQQRVNI